MKKLLLVGAGGFGKVVLEHANNDYECRFVDDGVEKGTMVCGCPIVGTIADLPLLSKEYSNLVVSIGNNRIREQIYEKARKLGFEFPNIICKSAYISPYAHIGCGCIVLNNSVIQNGAIVGNGVILSPGVEIHHDSTVGNNVLIYTNSVIRSFAHIGDRAWIGSTLTISNDVDVPEDAIIKNGRTLY